MNTIIEDQPLIDAILSYCDHGAIGPINPQVEDDQLETLTDDELLAALEERAPNEFYEFNHGTNRNRSEAEWAIIIELAKCGATEEQARRVYNRSLLSRGKQVQRRLNRSIDKAFAKAASEAPETFVLEAAAAIFKQASAAPSVATGRKLKTRSADTVTMEAIETLWDGMVPIGYLTLIAAETGAGKSTATCDFAARVTSGMAFPGQDPMTACRNPGRVLWAGSEDGISEMTVPRLTACGAVLANVEFIEGATDNGQHETFSFQDHLDLVATTLQEGINEGRPFTLVVADPVTSYLSGKRNRKVDMNDAGQVRAIFEPVMQLAQHFGVAFIGITHFAKDTQRSMLHRVLGSAAFAQTCRSLIAIVSRTQDGEFERSLIQIKSNLPEHPGGAWKFRTEVREVGTDAVSGKPIRATVPVWIGLDRGASVETAIGGTRGPVPDLRASFAEWLRKRFHGVDRNEGLPIDQVKNEAIEAGAITESGWRNHSARYLDKRNFAGVWRCVPFTTPDR